MQSTGKASRLETGAVTLEKKDAPLLDTLAQAMSGIVDPPFPCSCPGDELFTKSSYLKLQFGHF